MPRNTGRAWPTPRPEWVEKDDRCETAAGGQGIVLSVIPRTGVPEVKVRWDNGYTGYLSITLVRRVEEEA